MAVVLIGFGYYMINQQDELIDESVTEVTEITTTVATTKRTTAVTKPPHISPTETIISDTGKELSNLGVKINKTNNKTYLVELKNLVGKDEIIDTIKFYIRSENGDNLGNVQAGYGISVSEACPSANEKAWYRAADVAIETSGNECVIEWAIPDEIKDYINSQSGKVMLGYWWGDVETIIIDKISCSKKSMVDVPVDGKSEYTVDKILESGSRENKIIIPLSELLTKDDIPQVVSVKVEAADSLSDFSCSFGISAGDLFDGFYKEEGITASSNVAVKTISWLISDSLKKNIDYNGNFEFTYVSGNNSKIVVDNVTLMYSNNG